LALGGCGTISEKMGETVADAPLVGLPTGAPARPAAKHVFPAVHDMPPGRVTPVMSDVEQQKMESDLVAARTRQQIEAGLVEPEPPPAPPPPPGKKKPAPASASGPRVIPAATSATIY